MTFEYRDISPRIKLLILLLSLLINSIFILLILNSRHQQFIPLQTQVIKLDEEEIIPSQFMQPTPLGASQSQSATIPPTTTAPQTPTTPQQTPLPQQDFEWVSGAAGMGKPGSQEKEKITEAPAPKPEPVVEEETEENESESFEDSNSLIEPQTPEQSTDIPAGSAIIAEEPVVTQKQEPHTQLAAQKKSSQTYRPLPSLAELTKNFMDFTASDATIGTGGGGHAIGVTGGRTGVVSEKQLTYERYLRKVLVCISTSCKIHKRSIPRTAQKTQARVQFVLNRDGSYYTLAMAQSSGNPAIDDLILTIFNDACSSFPPVPQSLSVPFIAPMFILNSIQDLLVPEAWSVSIGA